MTDFWYLVLMLALAYLILILPSGFFFAETEAEKPIVSFETQSDYCRKAALSKWLGTK
jgi:hypothetical protein